MTTKGGCVALVCGVVLSGLVGCASTGTMAGQTELTTYTIGRVSQRIVIDAKWDKPVWQKVKPVELTHVMGDRPEHMPQTQVKLLYDDQNVYVIFQVDDRYVRVVARRQDVALLPDHPAKKTGAGYRVGSRSDRGGPFAAEDYQS